MFCNFRQTVVAAAFARLLLNGHYVDLARCFFRQTISEWHREDYSSPIVTSDPSSGFPIGLGAC